LTCATVMIALRTALDIWAPSAGPFALAYPTVLIATLFGHATAGLVAFTVTFGWAWFVVLPQPYSFQFTLDSDPPRVIINAVSVLVVGLLAEAFRRAVRAANEARDREIALRDMVMAELEHRTKNNFALVASMLSLQSRRQSTVEAVEALDQAAGRVHTFAQAYANLNPLTAGGAQVPMSTYLGSVVNRVSAGIFADNVSVDTRLDAHDLPTNVAVAIGLFVNEALTNCAKYAFPERRPGHIRVAFVRAEDGWAVSVSDNGVGAKDGESPDRTGRTGLGQGLMRAFAQQAGAEYIVEDTANGRCVQLTSRRLNS